MLQANVGDDGNFRKVDHVGGVERTAHADLQNDDVTLLLGKKLHGDGGDQLELAGMVFHGVSKDTNVFCDSCEVLSGNVQSVDLHALAEVLDIG